MDLDTMMGDIHGFDETFDENPVVEIPDDFDLLPELGF